MRRTLERKINLGFAFALVVLAAIATTEYRSISHSIETVNLVSRTHYVLEKLDDLLASMIDAESASRSFVLTGEDTFLEPYDSAMPQVALKLRVLRKLTIDRPIQQARLDTLDMLVAMKVAHVRDVVELWRTDKYGTAVSRPVIEQAKRITADIRSVIERMDNEETAVLQARITDAKIDIRNAILVIIIGGILTFVFVGLSQIVINIDIRKRRIAEESLRRSEERFQVVAQATNDAIWDWNLRTDELWLNDSFQRLFGPHQVENGDGIMVRHKRIHPEDRSHVMKSITEAIARGHEHWSSEYRFRRDDGTYASILDRAFVLHDDDKQPVRMVGSMVDLSEHKRAEQSQNAVYRIAHAADVTDGLPDLCASVHQIVNEVMPARNFCIALYDQESNLVTYPYFADERDGAPIPHVSGNRLIDHVLGTGDSLVCTPNVRERLEQDGLIEKEVHPPCTWIGVPLRVDRQTLGVMMVRHYENHDAFGDKERILLEFVSSQVARVITRKRADEALQRSEERYRSLVETATDIIVTLSVDERVTSLNYAFEKVTGWRCQDWVGQPLAGLLHPNDAHVASLMLQRTVADRVQSSYELRVRSRTGLYILGEFNITPQMQDDHVMGILGIVRDITERKRVENELRASRAQLRALAAHAQTIREEESTRIAREIHDELGQGLTGLKIDLQWIEKRLLPSQEALIHKVRSMTEAVCATMHTVQKISSELRPQMLDLGLVAAIEWQIREFQSRTGLACEVSICEDNVDIDEVRATAIVRILQEILTNIMRHARATAVSIQLQREREILYLRVTDNGRGITEQEISDQKSIGLLGMSERAHLFGGRVTIRGTQNCGTTIVVSLPLDHTDNAAPIAAPSPSESKSTLFFVANNA